MRNAPALFLILAHLAGFRLFAAEPPEVLAEALHAIEAGNFAAAAQLVPVDAGETGGWLEYVNGRVALAADDYAGAIDSFSAAAEKDGASALFQRWLGGAYLVKTQKVNTLAKMGPAKKGRQALAAAVELDPSYYDARESLVDYYLNAPAIAGGGVDKARAQAEEMEKISATEGRLLRARIHMHQEEYDQAAEVYRASAESRPDDVQLRFRLGMVEQQREDWEAAFGAFEEAIQIDPAFMGAYYQIGRTAVFSKENLERAVECMQTYLDHEQQPNTPGHEHAHWRLGLIHELRGDKAKARVAYEAALTVDPDHKDAKKALAGLGAS